MRAAAVEVVAFVRGDWRHVIRSPPMSGNNEVRAEPMSRVIISSDKPQPTATTSATEEEAEQSIEVITFAQHTFNYPPPPK